MISKGLTVIKELPVFRVYSPQQRLPISALFRILGLNDNKGEYAGDICHALRLEMACDVDIELLGSVKGIDPLDTITIISERYVRPASFYETLLLLRISKLRRYESLIGKIAVLDTEWSRVATERRFILLAKDGYGWKFTLFSPYQIMDSSLIIPCVTGEYSRQSRRG